MPTALNKAQIAALLAIGIASKTEEDARKKLVAFLKKNDVDGVDDDELKSLIEMAEVFYESSDDAGATEEDETEAEDELDEEPPVVAKKPTPAGKGKAPVKSDEDELEEVIEEVKSKGINVKKGAAPAAKPAAKPAATVVGRKTELTGDKWDGRNDKKHDAMIKPFRQMFSEKEFQIDLLKQGFTVRVLGTNAKTTVLNFDEIRIDNGTLVGNFYFNRFKSVEDLNAFLPEQYQEGGENEKVSGMFRGESHPCVRKVSADELIDILENSDLLTEALKRASSTDTKMGANREKLENSIKGSTTAAAPKAPAAKKPTPAPVEEVEEVDEIEELEELDEVEELDEADEFAGMDRTALKQWIAKNAADQIKVFKTDDDEAIREKIRAIVE